MLKTKLKTKPVSPTADQVICPSLKVIFIGRGDTGVQEQHQTVGTSLQLDLHIQVLVQSHPVGWVKHWVIKVAWGIEDHGDIELPNSCDVPVNLLKGLIHNMGCGIRFHVTTHPQLEIWQTYDLSSYWPGSPHVIGIDDFTIAGLSNGEKKSCHTISKESHFFLQVPDQVICD